MPLSLHFRNGSVRLVIVLHTKSVLKKVLKETKAIPGWPLVKCKKTAKLLGKK